MQFTIEPVVTPAQAAMAASVRRAVFETEFHLKSPPLDPFRETRVLDLLATVHSSGSPVATLSVVDTSQCDDFHAEYRLPFRSGTRTARYTRLAVLKQFRRLGLPMALFFEAHSRFVSAGRFTYTWLLMEPALAERSVFCTLLGFSPHTQIEVPGYGPRVTLIRNESASHPMVEPDVPSKFDPNVIPGNGGSLLDWRATAGISGS